MQRMTITLLALQKHYPALLDEFALPEAINRNDFIGRLLMEHAESEVAITNPEVMAPLVGFWSRTRLPSWTKLADMIGYEYNPIWNVDGETWHEGESTRHSESSGTSSDQRSFTRDRNQVDTIANTHNDTRTPDITERRTPNITEQTDISGSETTTNYISADNSEGWSNDTKTEKDYAGRTDTKSISGSETNTTTGTEQTTGSDNTNDTLTEDISDTETRNGSTTGEDDTEGSESWHERRQGNAGITMTQQLLEAEKNLWSAYDVEGFIINEFKKEFLLMVY